VKGGGEKECEGRTEEKDVKKGIRRKEIKE
jgi:hypothetical protein